MATIEIQSFPREQKPLAGTVLVHSKGSVNDSNISIDDFRGEVASVSLEYTSTSASNVYTLSPKGKTVNPSELHDGMTIAFTVDAANTATPVIDIIGVQRQLYANGVGVQPGGLVAGETVIAKYDDTNSRWNIIVGNAVGVTIEGAQTINGEKTFSSVVKTLSGIESEELVGVGGEKDSVGLSINKLQPKTASFQLSRGLHTSGTRGTSSYGPTRMELFSDTSGNGVVEIDVDTQDAAGTTPSWSVRFRVDTNGCFVNGNKVLTTADEGILDAGTVDGLNSTQFLRSDADTGTSGTLSCVSTFTLNADTNNVAALSTPASQFTFDAASGYAQWYYSSRSGITLRDASCEVLTNVYVKATNDTPSFVLLDSNGFEFGRFFKRLGTDETTLRNIDNAGNISDFILTTSGIKYQNVKVIRQNDYASVTTNGVVELATDQETIDGVDNLRAVVPSGLQAFSESVVPIGSIITWPLGTIPAKFIPANGATLSRTIYDKLFAVYGTTFGAGDGSTTFGIPDLRGLFLRGLDDGRGLDSGRSIGTFQADEIRSHRHNLAVETSAGGAYQNPVGAQGTNYTDTDAVQPFGGAETRPVNFSVQFLIRYK